MIEVEVDGAKVEVRSALGGTSDPFCDDADGGASRMVGTVGLQRLAIVAAAVGARFEREAVPHDPAAWMLAPRAMFDGACAIDACLGRAGFERALVLHAPGAGLGLDADPDLLDDLLSDDDDEEEVGAAPGGQLVVLETGPRHDPPVPPRGRRGWTFGQRAAASSPSGDRLYSSAFSMYAEGGRLLVFVAAVVDSEHAFRNRLFERYGAVAALGAEVREGFDLFDRIGMKLISEHVADHLAVLCACPDRASGHGFVVVLEQRA